LSSHQQDILRNIDSYLIGIDDIFAFKCRSCGKCCKNRDDILLNPRDVFNIATALKITQEQVVEEYCETYIGKDSRMPVVRLRPKGKNKVCPLLEGGRCIVHSLKPTVCALFPIGRIVASEHAPEEIGLGNPNEIKYIKNNADCGSRKRKQTVRAWLEAFNIPIDDVFFIQWNKTIFQLMDIVKMYEGKSGVTDKAMEMLWYAIFQSLYIDYDISKDFFTQFKANANKILALFAKLEQYKGGD